MTRKIIDVKDNFDKVLVFIKVEPVLFIQSIYCKIDQRTTGYFFASDEMQNLKSTKSSLIR